MRGSHTPLKRSYRLRDGDQIPTRPVSIAEIMSDPKFAQGAEDVRHGRGYLADYDTWEDTNDRWAYERGRQWATVAPRHVVLKANGKITTAAWRWYAREEIL